MSFVLTAWKLTIFLLLVSAFFFFAAYRATNKPKSVIKTKQILFVVAFCYLAIAHFSMLVAIGQSLDENYEAPCEWLVNTSNEIFIYGDNYSGHHWDYASPPAPCNPNDLDCVNLFHVNRTYTYFDSCANTTAPAISASLVVIFLYLLWCGAFAVVIYLMIWAKDYFTRII